MICLISAFTKASAQQTSEQGTRKAEKKFFLNHEITRNIDFEVYLNHKVVTKSRETDHMPGPYELNPHLVPGSKQRIKIKLMPAPGAKTIRPQTIENINKNIGIYLLENRDYDHIKTVKLLKFPVITKNTAEYTYEWTFLLN